MPQYKPQQFAKKSLGQHFLKDVNAIQRIINLAEIKDGEQILEIGPGPGALTKLLREFNYGKLLLLEKDDELAAKHKKYALDNNLEHMEVLTMDALTFDWKNLQGEWKIISNLPYNVASPMMWDIVSQVPNFTRAVFMIQKEVAQRIRASEGNKTYGALSVWIQSFCKIEKGFIVGPLAFSPPPKVDSEVIVFTPLAKEKLPKDPQNLSRLIKICFQQRRKQIHGVLQKALPHNYNADIWETLGIDMHCRAETLSPQDFQRLCALLFPQKS